MSAMVLIVDFNMVEEDGRIPALIPTGEVTSLESGMEVVAVDAEGTECRAVVDEVASDGRYAMLIPIDGTTRDSSGRTTSRAP